MASSDADVPEECAACGKRGDVLKKCGACKLVKYCGSACQRAHRREHKERCLARAAELFDETLFKQPPHEDCPICFLRLAPTELGENGYKSCCGKTICNGCLFAIGSADNRLFCPFCRAPGFDDAEEHIGRLKKRMEMDDATAFREMGTLYFEGSYGLTRDAVRAHELLQRAAGLGSADAHCQLACIYRSPAKYNEKKALYHDQQGAIGGSTSARHSLGISEFKRGNFERATKHWVIAAGDGSKRSLDSIQLAFSGGVATKVQYENALCAYQKYKDETKSDQRDEVAAFMQHAGI